MKNYILKLTLLSILLFEVSSCDTVDFNDTNIDPDATTAAISSGLLTYAESQIGSAVTAETGNLYVQYISNITYTEGSRYGTRNWDIDYLYYGPLINLQTIIDLNSDEETALTQVAYGFNDNQIAVAKLLKAYFYQFATDRWGMLPYSEALQGLDNTTPVFDSQEEIYLSLFDEIDDALALINTSEAGPTGDLIFDGDMTRWIQFANTLKLSMALRLSNVYPGASGVAATKFQEAMSGAISSNAENLLYPFIADQSYDNPWEDRFETREDYAVSDVFVNRLLADDDSRIDVYAEYTRSSVVAGDPQYIGMPYGLTTSSYAASDVSFITSDIIYDQTAPGVIYSYAQVLFSYAEAVKLGWISGSASDYYEAAITASYEQWGAADADAYIATVPLSTNDAAAMQQIAEEKWKALFLQGYEAWAEWRRLGYPELTPAAEPLNGSDIPVRHGYDLDWSQSNSANYEAAVSTQGEDNLGTNLWWDAPHPITNQ
ncbi:MAG: SusD/RagB family nutrient-binding outer membrane lipoprotein [Bacteroidota bacterium]|nr:SusD/RagB family nutrient-binding outer membrane lipoprotein [Bacteroidota bacterium]MEE3147077.1 SusD/RagB family nutrient-binding outer membrane lipoprotein [Bacteroidota bacterium]MEE3226455.1 SusD/RagB family nutrient-binding outer membrane lipoprotein [Bacteroidota bacterium]MEE3244397.1 SusD/RagB family nutrient-binding outer membrane lipoprotein [Bacteroidota bacterium]